MCMERPGSPRTTSTEIPVLEKITDTITDDGRFTIKQKAYLLSILSETEFTI